MLKCEEEGDYSNHSLCGGIALHRGPTRRSPTLALAVGVILKVMVPLSDMDENYRSSCVGAPKMGPNFGNTPWACLRLPITAFAKCKFSASPGFVWGRTIRCPQQPGYTLGKVPQGTPKQQDFAGDPASCVHRFLVPSNENMAVASYMGVFQGLHWGSPPIRVKKGIMEKKMETAGRIS